MFSPERLVLLSSPMACWTQKPCTLEASYRDAWGTIVWKLQLGQDGWGRIQNLVQRKRLKSSSRNTLFKTLFCLQFKPMYFCHISSSISPMHLEGSRLEGSLVTQTNKICSNVSHRRELNLANFYWSFTCTCVRGLSKIHWLCVAFICWPQWISLLQLCCPSHVCALAEGE